MLYTENSLKILHRLRHLLFIPEIYRLNIWSSMNMKLYMIALTALVVLQSCSNAEARNEKRDPKTWLVSAEAKTKQSVDQVRESNPLAALFIKNGYTAYRITYNTIGADGKELVASGAVFVPDTRGPLPLLNYNHGTYFPSQERNAPSYLGHGDEISIGKLFSAAGYLVVMPDYIGYGSTKKEKHPYGAYHLIAASVTDMLRAVKEFCDKNDITLSGQNFFSGWSEGAAVSLATVKALEEDNSKEFTPTASVLNAGPYYTSGFARHVVDSKEHMRYMASYVWILRSYNRIYNINKPDSWYFKEPFASRLKNDPETYMPGDPQELFSDSFRESFSTGKETALDKAMLENDLWDWKPRSRVVFCHGDKDDYVPLFNSEKAYSSMKAKGADVSLQVFKGHTHRSSAMGYVQQLLTELQRAK